MGVGGDRVRVLDETKSSGKSKRYKRENNQIATQGTVNDDVLYSKPVQSIHDCLGKHISSSIKKQNSCKYMDFSLLLHTHQVPENEKHITVNSKGELIFYN